MRWLIEVQLRGHAEEKGESNELWSKTTELNDQNRFLFLKFGGPKLWYWRGLTADAADLRRLEAGIMIKKKKKSKLDLGASKFKSGASDLPPEGTKR